MMNTEASTVEKERIHLYLHLKYVKSPETRTKKEYHSLVSPIVFKGGLSRRIQRSTINDEKTRMDNELRKTAHFLFV
jgi:hypothetical protein